MKLVLEQGLTVAQAAKKAGVAESSIRRMLHRMGAPLPLKN